MSLNIQNSHVTDKNEYKRKKTEIKKNSRHSFRHVEGMVNTYKKNINKRMNYTEK